MQYGFGAGSMWAVPTISLDGTVPATPTPIPFAGLQEGSVEFSGNSKELYGPNQFPLITMPGHRKITGKSKLAQISATALNAFFGETPATGEIRIAKDEAGTVPGSSTYIITVTNSAKWTTDLGVTYALTGLPLARGTVAAVGVYSVAAGVYTFDVADKSLAMKLSYAYTTSAAPGQVITINNNLLGSALFFKTILSMVVQGKYMTLTLNRCISNKLTIATKLEDFLIPEFDFAAMADDAGVVGTFSFYSG